MMGYGDTRAYTAEYRQLLTCADFLILLSRKNYDFKERLPCMEVSIECFGHH